MIQSTSSLYSPKLFFKKYKKIDVEVTQKKAYGFLKGGQVMFLVGEWVSPVG